MSGQIIDRRDFLATGAALVASGSGLAGGSAKSKNKESTPKAKNMVGGYSTIITQSKIFMSPCAGSMISLKDGRVMWVWGAAGVARAPHTMQANFSSDSGRTWSDPAPLKLRDGSNMRAFFSPNIARLKSGKIGLVQMQEAVAGWNKPGGMIINSTFHISEDEGKTWSAGVPMPYGTREYPYFDQLHVLSSGRLIVASTFLMGPTPSRSSDNTTLYGQVFDNAHMTTLAQGATAYYSDDEGMTWKRSFNEVFASAGLNGIWHINDNGLAELPDGRILMLGRSTLQKIYRSYSEDHGQTWSEAEPTELQANGPMSVKVIPGTNDVLLTWAQISSWEEMNGLYRHRLSVAITSDGGKTFHSFKNLESLDDVAQLEPEPPTPVMQGVPFKQPVDTKRYFRAPGPLRCDHPSCAFHDGNAIIAYGMGAAGDPEMIRRFFGESMEHFCERFGFEMQNGNSRKILGSNKVRVIPIKEL